MKKFRFQFSLRTVFIVSFIIAIVCSLWKCERDSKNNFTSAVNSIHESLKKIQAEFDAEHHTISSEGDGITPPHQCSQRILIDPQPSCTGGYIEGYVESKIFTWYVWSDHGLTRSDWRSDDSIETSIRCTRPCSIKSRQPLILIVTHPAKENHLVLDRLKKRLADLGFPYEITEEKSPYH